LEKINALSLSWTLVHPITEESPCLNSKRWFCQYTRWNSCFCKTFDDMFSNTVAIRTSYTFEEVIYGLNLHRCILEASTTQYLYLDKLNSFTDAPFNVIWILFKNSKLSFWHKSIWPMRIRDGGVVYNSGSWVLSWKL
jgi:inward rectifier potassium channel